MQRAVNKERMQRAVNNQVGQLLTGSLLNNSMEAKNAQIPNEITCTFFSNHTCIEAGNISAW